MHRNAEFEKHMLCITTLGPLRNEEINGDAQTYFEHNSHYKCSDGPGTSTHILTPFFHVFLSLSFLRAFLTEGKTLKTIKTNKKNTESLRRTCSGQGVRGSVVSKSPCKG